RKFTVFRLSLVRQPAVCCSLASPGISLGHSVCSVGPLSWRSLPAGEVAKPWCLAGTAGRYRPREGGAFGVEVRQAPWLTAPKSIHYKAFEAVAQSAEQRTFNP